ncbi:S1 RNA-binding domain-containing protein [Pseudogemmobacter sonorensis]|uniref:S1 RNA-binding domain-containing protein n=1 Tax=Pseudogemmobacter sonorensis TaxID=2989681 RepID=UPI0036BD7BD7
MIIDPSMLLNESDVEQKLLMPLMTANTPYGLMLPPSNIYTKQSIRSVTIDKGGSKKNYYPDYLYVHRGIPIMAVEAKTPGEDLVEALREARLYASEINSKHSGDVDPVKFVVACDGTRLLAGYNNDETPLFDILAENFSSENVDFSKFITQFGFASLDRWGEKIVKKLRPIRYFKPRKMVGGGAAQSEEIGLNSFGSTIKTDFRGLFDPGNIAERDVIAAECYIPSKRRNRYVDSIDRTFAAIISPSEKIASQLDDSSNPLPIIKKLRQGQTLANQVMLLIGSAGAGKTTFVDHLRVSALPTDVRRSTRWLHINLNVAPVSRDEIYKWLRKEIIAGVKAQLPKVDFEELETIKQIFRADVESYRKGTGRLHEGNKDKWNEKLADKLDESLANEHKVATCYCKYLSSRESALIVIVLDNCDKRELTEQLLMFEAAQWLRTEFDAMIFLPIREETYDKNHDRPPLDTALKDLAFRIEPPRFDLILKKRVDVAVARLKENPTQRFSYDLPNSMKATYTASDKVSYLTSILRSVFDSEEHIRRLLIGLAGRNMRRAMEIFLEFCSSGHISEDHILKMVSSGGSYALPLELVSRVILRPKRRYYDSDHSYVVNLMAADIADKKPSFFCRVAILRSLAGIAHDGQSARKDGYMRGEDMLPQLEKFGITQDILLREINYLVGKHCVVSEDFSLSGIELNTLIAISPAGRTHLFLLNNPHYVSAMAEDTWFRQEAVANAIKERIKNPAIHFENRSALMNAKNLVSFLERERALALEDYNMVFPDSDGPELISVSSLRKTVDLREKQMVGNWAGVDEVFPVGKKVSGIVSAVKGFGIFVKFENEVSGLLHANQASAADLTKKSGDAIEVIVTNVDQYNEKLGLKSIPT